MADNTPVALEVALLAVYSLAILLLIMVAYTILHRFLSLWQEGYAARRRARLEEAVAMLVAEETDPVRFLRQLPRADYTYAEELLLEYAAKFGPEVRSRLAPVFDATGALQRNRRRTRSRKWWRRADGARRFGLMGDANVSRFLRPLLRDGNVEVRMAAGRSLLELGATDWIDDLVQTLADPNLLSTLRIADVILGAGAQAVPSLVDFISANPGARGVTTALEILGDMRAVAASPVIAGPLQTSSSADVRAAACRALGRLETPDAVELLVSALDDEAWEVRAQALRALGRIGDPTAAPAVFRLLAGENPWVIFNAATALAAMGPDVHLQLEEAYRRRLATEAGAPSMLTRVLGEVLSPYLPEGQVTVV
ncbi:MAG: lyase domain protein repeat-containing protein [Symbiobacteriaceae bacterium]|jgi:hypothetical protein|nr:lyase domain protein repeat-containing protein [Symbiobacteriaceae bacterium]